MLKSVFIMIALFKLLTIASSFCEIYNLCKADTVKLLGSFNLAEYFGERKFFGNFLT